MGGRNKLRHSFSGRTDGHEMNGHSFSGRAGKTAGHSFSGRTDGHVLDGHET